MSWDTTDLELYVTSDNIQVWYRSKYVFSIGVDDEGQFCFAIADEVFDAMRVGRYLPVELKKLIVYILNREESEEHRVGLPRLTKKRAEDRVIEPRRRATTAPVSVSVDNIETSMRDRVLDAILDSEVDNPDMTIVQRRAETRRIAEQFDQRFYAVAGVRACLEKGQYGGSRAELIAKRRRQRAAAARKANGATKVTAAAK